MSQASGVFALFRCYGCKKFRISKPIKLSGNGWSTGFNIGLLYQPNEGTRVGLHYRSGIGHALNGNLELSGLRGPLASANGRASTRTRLDLPDMLSLSLTQALSPRWTLLGPVQ